MIWKTCAEWCSIFREFHNRNHWLKPTVWEASYSSIYRAKVLFFHIFLRHWLFLTTITRIHDTTLYLCHNGIWTLCLPHYATAEAHSSTIKCVCVQVHVWVRSYRRVNAYTNPGVTQCHWTNWIRIDCIFSCHSHTSLLLWVFPCYRPCPWSSN